jgi:hypothetical protein
MAINSDSSGFLIGERRLKEMSEGITQTEDNTKQILKILTTAFRKCKIPFQAAIPILQI